MVNVENGCVRRERYIRMNCKYDIGMYEKAAPDGLALDEKMRMACRCGYDYIEFCVDMLPERAVRLEWSREERKRWRMLSYDMNIPFKTLSLSLLRKMPLGTLNQKINEQSLKIIEKAAMLAADIGSRIILVNGYDVYGEPSTDETKKRYYENLQKAADICSKYGLIIGIENSDTAFCATVQQVVEMANKVASPYVQVYADIANAVIAAEGDNQAALEDIRTGAGKIVAMHLKDMVPNDYRYTKYGEGNVDFEANIKLAKKLGVHMFTAELFCDGEMNYEEKAKNVNRFLRAHLDKVYY